MIAGSAHTATALSPADAKGILHGDGQPGGDRGAHRHGGDIAAGDKPDAGAMVSFDDRRQEHVSGGHGRPEDHRAGEQRDDGMRKARQDPADQRCHRVQQDTLEPPSASEARGGGRESREAEDGHCHQQARGSAGQPRIVPNLVEHGRDSHHRGAEVERQQHDDR